MGYRWGCRVALFEVRVSEAALSEDAVWGPLMARGRVALKAWLGIIDLLGGGCTKGLANSTPGRWCIYPAPSSDRVSLRGWVIEFYGTPATIQSRTGGVVQLSHVPRGPHTPLECVAHRWVCRIIAGVGSPWVFRYPLNLVTGVDYGSTSAPMDLDGIGAPSAEVRLTGMTTATASAF